MDPMNVPTDVTKLVYTCPLSISKAVSQEQVAVLLAHYWPAIEKHVRAQVLDEAAEVAEQVGRRVQRDAPLERRGEGAWESSATLRRMADEARAAR